MAVTLSPVGIGTGSFRGLYRDVPDDEAIEAIHAALDSGVTLIDTAPWYGAFQTEAIIGKALQGRPRESYRLSTKACLWSENGQMMRGYTRDQVLWSVEGSLKRLGVDSVEMLHIHDPLTDAYQTIVEETYPTLAALKAQGVIGAISVSTGDLAAAVQFAADLPLDALMLAGRYTLLDQSALHLLDALHERGTPVLSAGIYNTGILATGSMVDAKYNYGGAPPEIRARVEALEQVCARHGVSLKAAAAQFVRQHPAITALVFGIESADQLREALASFDMTIPPAFWHDLKADGMIDPEAPTPGA